MLVVKKYGNRRLYDTEESRYITLEELTEKVRHGAEVRVVDAKTHEDLTQATLTQIIIEGRGAGRLLPVPLLMQLIRLNDESLAEFFGRYVTAALELYNQARQGAQTLSPYNPFALLPFSASSAIARLINPAAAWVQEPPPPPPPAQAQAPPAAQRSDVDDLRRELEELKRSLKKRRR